MSNWKKMLMSAPPAGGYGSGPKWLVKTTMSNSSLSIGSVATDSADNIYVFGNGGIFSGQAFGGDFDNDAFLIKFNKARVQQWAKFFGSTSVESRGGSLAVDSSDNVIITGMTDGGVSGQNEEQFVAKFNSSGTLQWQRAVGSTARERGQGVGVDSSDNVYVTGFRVGNNRSYLIKLNSSGTSQWQRYFAGANTSYQTFGTGIAFDSSDNVYVSGAAYTWQSSVSSSFRSEGILLKWNSSGTLQWSRGYGNGGSYRNVFQGLAIDSSNNIYTQGYTTDSTNGSGGYDLILVKWNSSGSIQWQKMVGGSGTDQQRGYNNTVAVDSLDDVYITGDMTSDGAGSEDFYLAKFNSSGTLQWDKNLGTSSSDFGYGVAVDSTDCPILYGHSYVSGEPILTARLDPDGNGNGTYGGFTYQDAVITVNTPSLSANTSPLSGSGSSTDLTVSTSSLSTKNITVTSTKYSM